MSHVQGWDDMNKPRLKFELWEDKHDDTTDKPMWHVYNKKDEFLGTIDYYDEWKKFVWEQEGSVVMTADCLVEVAKFMEENKNVRTK